MNWLCHIHVLTSHLLALCMLFPPVGKLKRPQWGEKPLALNKNTKAFLNVWNDYHALLKNRSPGHDNFEFVSVCEKILPKAVWSSSLRMYVQKKWWVREWVTLILKRKESGDSRITRMINTDLFFVFGASLASSHSSWQLSDLKVAGFFLSKPPLSLFEILLHVIPPERMIGPVLDFSQENYHALCLVPACVPLHFSVC